MEELRTSLWSRLVVFYSVNKRDQLNPQVMAEIVAKYGSREKELSARLLKKYGRPLPPSVPAQELRRVLLEFGMEDQDVPRGAGQGSVGGPAAGDGASEEGAMRDPTGGAHQNRAQEGQQHHGGRQAERPPRGSELNFRSKFFDPLQALNHDTLRPPFPRERALDNLAKFARMLPKRASSAAAASGSISAGGPAAGAEAIALPPATSALKSPAAAAAGATATATSGASHGTPQPDEARKLVQHPTAELRRSKPVEPESAAARGGRASKPSAEKAKGGIIAAGGRDAVSQRSPGESGVGGSIGGHYAPPVGSAEELARIDKERASKRRNAELLVAGGAVATAVPDGEKFNPVQRIMREYSGKGPYSLLYRLHEDKRRASVMIRRVNSIRGTCTGLIRAFDRHMNLLLVDVREDYTAFVPARDPRPESKRQEQQRPSPGGAPPLDPLKDAGGVGTDEEDLDLRGKQLADVRDTGSASQGLSIAGAGGDGGEGGWGGGGSVGWGGGGSVSWGGGGSVGWGGGGGVVEEAEGASRVLGEAAALDAQTEGAFGVEEVEGGWSSGTDAFGGGSGGGGRGGSSRDRRSAVAPATGSTGAPAEFADTESARVRNEALSSLHAGEKPRVAGAGGLGSSSRQSRGVSSRDPERGPRLGGAQPPPGEEGVSGSTRTGRQGRRGSSAQHFLEGKDSGGLGEGGRGSGTAEAKKRSTRKSRARGPWRGELVAVRRRRFLKQLMIRGDNVVMIWEESPKR